MLIEIGSIVTAMHELTFSLIGNLSKTIMT